MLQRLPLRFQSRETPAAATDEYSKSAAEMPPQNAARAAAYIPPGTPDQLSSPAAPPPPICRKLRAPVPSTESLAHRIPRRRAFSIPSAPSRLLTTIAISASGMRPAADALRQRLEIRSAPRKQHANPFLHDRPKLAQFPEPQNSRHNLLSSLDALQLDVQRQSSPVVACLHARTAQSALYELNLRPLAERLSRCRDKASCPSTLPDFAAPLCRHAPVPQLLPIQCRAKKDGQAANQQEIQQARAADEAAIRAASAAWSQSATAKDLDKAVSFYADDAVILPDKAPAVRGHENIPQELGPPARTARPRLELENQLTRSRALRRYRLRNRRLRFRHHRQERKINRYERQICGRLEETNRRLVESRRGYGQHRSIEQARAHRGTATLGCALWPLRTLREKRLHSILQPQFPAINHPRLSPHRPLNPSNQIKFLPPPLQFSFHPRHMFRRHHQNHPHAQIKSLAAIHPASIAPSRAKYRNIGNTGHEPKSITACTFAGKARGKFPVIPPPVICAMVVTHPRAKILFSSGQ